MRHRKSGRKLSRDSDHRKALRRNMVADLFAHGQIVTTEAKARMIRPVAERIITIAKRGLEKGGITTVNARRLVSARIYRFRTIEEDFEYVEIDIVKKLFDEIAPALADRPGGYTRMIKLPPRSGDNAKMALVQLVADKAGETGQ
ncbi:MAG: large subunit ribosomal protein L17 [Cellvibrionaceae bacterium]|jgi:large subunit ribosomal protein L17